MPRRAPYKKEVFLTRLRSGFPIYAKRGFEIARRDLDLRGPGELLGTRQAGPHRLKVADLGRDGELLAAVADAGWVLLRRHPESVDSLVRRWLGDALHYGSV